MTTPSPDKQETLEEIATNIVNLYYPDDDELEDEIISALRNERERCAKRCDKEAEEWREYAKNYTPGDAMRKTSMSRASTADELAAAIREGR